MITPGLRRVRSLFFALSVAVPGVVLGAAPGFAGSTVATGAATSVVRSEISTPASAVRPVQWGYGRRPIARRAFRSCKRFARKVYRGRTRSRVRIVSIERFYAEQGNRFFVAGTIRVLDGRPDSFYRFRCRTKRAKVVWFR
ncbi:MAG: hypothetical protein C0606_15595 [Hyphomicrobiales bacterium]|nr:MAG: hypothetical protein C0606_15595 [Hyphomicrobiales bacterium]